MTDFAVSDVKTFLNESYNAKANASIAGYNIDESLSNRQTKTYYNPETNKAVVVHRGTSGVHDIWTDVKLGLGIQKGERWRRARRDQRKAEEKYGADNITTMGHSLGGTLATKFGQKTNHVISLNRPEMAQTRTKAEKRSKTTSIHTSSDILQIGKDKHAVILPTPISKSGFISGHKTTALDKFKGKNITVGRLRERSKSKGKDIIQTIDKGVRKVAKVAKLIKRGSTNRII